MFVAMVTIGFMYDYQDISCRDWQQKANYHANDLSVYTISSARGCSNLDVDSWYFFPNSTTNSLRIDFDDFLTDIGSEMEFESYGDDLTSPLERWSPSNEIYDFEIRGHNLRIKLQTNSQRVFGYTLVVDPAFCEDFVTSPGETYDSMDSQTIASPHDYCNNMDVTQQYTWTNSKVRALKITWDEKRHELEYGDDTLDLTYVDISGQTVVHDAVYGGNFTMDANAFTLHMTTNREDRRWGFEMTVIPLE
eukprot:CAMPEP_0115007668 /NCGR_PEP_ID=MMETSP0216-20121206/21352_1 /TAXON_ID=223996 /ORGANISM="Protocruzia adherens, Strain Boccale" /LENGTH=248 /DNA_ID=CAMNT_0002374725 /DNA_START=74 /DNA_END=823 /DNA_ORIENTATION=+